MKKFKIILPSIALIVVLALSITMGVYAASTATFTITSTITFNSPNLEGLIIECYVVNGQSSTLKHTYTTNGDAWDFSAADKALTFSAKETYTEESGLSYEVYAPITLKFVIKHTTAIPVYAYFTEGANYITEDELMGQEQTTTKLVDVVFNDEIDDGIVGGDTSSTEYKGGEVSIDLSLVPNVTLVEDKISFNYTLNVIKTKPNFDVAE